jgi:hypothetical protein
MQLCVFTGAGGNAGRIVVKSASTAALAGALENNGRLRHRTSRKNGTNRENNVG